MKDAVTASFVFAVRQSDNPPMDDIVRQALAKWPNVPHCHGWLGLDARGNWYMRDDRVQAAGAFPASKGSLLKHEKLLDFIRDNNPAALREIAERFREAAQRGLWTPRLNSAHHLLEELSR